jgi:hypothetical protein
MMPLEESVTNLLVALMLLFGLLAAWAGWYLIAMERERTAYRHVGDSFAVPEKRKTARQARRLQPLRVRICEGQIFGRNKPRLAASGNWIALLRAGLRRAQTR